ncbi:hypothetical protein [Streptomyces sp. NPDC014734]|uniref:hypothetical protein n=1 Tax=Streptomyces sp. NPDC014734 TaxID=3364886 RepID=UPI0036FF40C5
MVADGAGEPAGLLHEGAQALVQNALPPLSRQERTEAVRSALATLVRPGVTSRTGPGLGPGGGIVRGHSGRRPSTSAVGCLPTANRPSASASASCSCSCSCSCSWPTGPRARPASLPPDARDHRA